MRVQLCASKRSSPRPPIIISILNRIATPQSTTRSECVSCVVSCRVVSRTPSKAVRVGAWLACGRAREPEPSRLVQLAAGLQPQAGSSCLIHGSRPFVPHPNLYIPRPTPIRWQMVPRLHSPHPIDASKKRRHGVLTPTTANTWWHGHEAAAVEGT